MKNKILEFRPFKFGLVLAMTFLVGATAYAGFGVSPPYIHNQHLSRGFHYEQKIILVRGDPVEDLKVQMIVDVPEANDWISINKGTEFIMPKGEEQVPIVVKVDIPKDAEYKEYKGKIGIKTMSLIPSSSANAPVGIELGGEIDIDLIVDDRDFSDFKVNSVKVNDLETAHQWLLWDVSGIIKFEMQVENLGNVPVSPTRVALDIYDSSNSELLEKSQTVEIAAVKPFSIQSVTANIPTSLPPGGYWAKYQIFKEGEIVKSGEVHLSLLSYGSLAYSYHTPFVEFSQMSAGDQGQVVLLSVLLLVILCLVVFILFKWRKRRRARR